MVSSSASRVQVNDLLSRVLLSGSMRIAFSHRARRQAYLMLAQIHCDLSPMANPIGDIVAAT
jgi:hypothetical protein